MVEGRQELDYSAHVRSESALFLAALRGRDLSASVPTCPGWSAADLLWHLAEVQHFWGTIVSERLVDPSTYQQPVRPRDHHELIGCFEQFHQLLHGALDAAPDELAVWTWHDDDHSVGFIRRRQAHEALIHRLDAEATAGTEAAVDPALATDGVAEALEYIFGGIPAWATVTDRGPVGSLSTSDTGASWLVRVDSFVGTDPLSGEEVDDAGFVLIERGDPTFSVTATARDLDAWLWNRPPRGPVVRTGDRAAAEPVIGSRD